VLPACAAHVFVGDLDAPVLSDADSHHLFRVLRVRPGEQVTVSDGAGRWRSTRATADGLEPDGDVTVVPRPTPPITIACALLKGDRTEWVVQKLTELGVDRVVPMRTEHTVVKWSDEKSARAHERLGEVMRAAAMQARLVWLPEVEPVTGFAEVAGADGAALAHPGGDAPSLARPTVLIGPEGGWSAAELAAAPATVDLGSTNLRADTAAIAAGVRLTALR
jgi:16S rRNA (uracil1498-N3)-methyltransferase